MSDKELYFLALIPPKDISDHLWDFKQQMAKRFLSVASLRSPPHVTLHMPFRLSDKKKDNLVRRLTHFCKDTEAFRLTLNGFGAFPPKVIYIKVEANNQLLTFQKSLSQVMAQKLSIHNANYQNKPFRPHITIGFRDLKRDQFQKAWDYYQDKKYQADCCINQLTLLKHNTSHWLTDVHFQFEV